jgi:CRP-like cAMP-binding protein
MSSNRLLARLSRADLRLLEPHLQAVDLPVRRPLAARNRRIEHIYFPESGVMSVVADGEHAIEIGIIGREGMSGVSLILGGSEKSPYETYVQIAGHGQRIPASNLLEAVEASVTLHKELLKYANSFLIQTTQTALANGRHKIEERLARWLLMARDRIDSAAAALVAACACVECNDRHRHAKDNAGPSRVRACLHGRHANEVGFPPKTVRASHVTHLCLARIQIAQVGLSSIIPSDPGMVPGQA